jgi:Spy/CpxP family protein refolding chaperone
MNPMFAGWWQRHEGACGPAARVWFGGGCGDSSGADDPGAFDAAGGFGGGPFGVRRPLRVLAHKLGLSESQIAEVAAILDELKTERAQAAVDFRRTTSAWADALTAQVFDSGRAHEIRSERVQAAERVQLAVSKAVARLHAALDEEQRKKLAYLLRTGALVI